MAASALIIHDVPIECINVAAIAYHIPASLVVSVLMTEGGRNGLAKPNANGTFDYGPMQINTIWIDKLKQYGYTRYDIQYNPCVNVLVGTWILGQSIAEADNLNYGIGSYNSHTWAHNSNYWHKVAKNYQFLQHHLTKPAMQTPATSTAVTNYSFDQTQEVPEK